jgi:hypothetical protein
MFNPYVIGAVALAWLLSLVGVGVWQRADGAAAVEVRVAKAQQEHVAKVTTLNSEIVQTHRKLEIAEANKVLQVRTNTIHNVTEVPVYVTKIADARCVVPVGLVLHHNRAAAGLPVDSTPASGLVNADSGLAISEVETIITGNYGTAHQWRVELESCRKMYSAAYLALKQFTTVTK